MASMHVRLASGEEVMTLSAEELLGWLLVKGFYSCYKNRGLS